MKKGFFGGLSMASISLLMFLVYAVAFWSVGSRAAHASSHTSYMHNVTVMHMHICTYKYVHSHLYIHYIHHACVHTYLLCAVPGHVFRSPPCVQSAISLNFH